MDDKISIPRNLAKRLERVTRKAGVTPSVLVRTAPTNQLDYQEWFLKSVDEGVADLDAGRVFTTRQVLAALDKQPHNVADISARRRLDPYCIVYRVKPTAVQIVRVLHQTRKYFN